MAIDRAVTVLKRHPDCTRPVTFSYNRCGVAVAEGAHGLIDKIAVLYLLQVIVDPPEGGELISDARIRPLNKERLGDGGLMLSVHHERFRKEGYVVVNGKETPQVPVA